MDLISPVDAEAELLGDPPPEPPPSVLEPLPLLSPADPEEEPPEPEPPPSPLEDDALPAVGREADDTAGAKEEPEGDELSWAEPPTGEETTPEPTAPEPDSGTWEDDGAGPEVDEQALWDALEDEYVVVVGYEELVELPSLGWAGVLAQASSLHAQTELHTREPALLAQDTLVVTLSLAGQVLEGLPVRVVATSSQEPLVILGRDVLGGRFLVDAGRRRLVSPD